MNSERTVKVIVVVAVAVTILVPAEGVSGWGPITHATINRRAAGRLGEEFATGGHSADMIAFYHVTRRSSRFDYAHNPAGEGFGQEMAKTVEETCHPERYQTSDRIFALGWAGHQIADSFVHGPGGYSEAKEAFHRMPEEFKESLNHGLTELMVDAIVLHDISGARADLSVSDHGDLIHETAVRVYNASASLTRDQIVSCGIADELAASWEGWMRTSTFLARLATTQPWFEDARRFYADYRGIFDRAVDAVGNLVGWASPWQTEVAMAADEDRAEEETDEVPEAAYYRFLARVAEEAKRLGGGKITDESLRQALAKVVEEDMAGGTEEARVWAKLVEELYLKDNKSFDQVIRNVEDYARKSQHKEPSRSLTLWLLLGLAVALAGFAVLRLIKLIRGGEKHG